MINVPALTVIERTKNTFLHTSNVCPTESQFSLEKKQRKRRKAPKNDWLYFLKPVHPVRAGGGGGGEDIVVLYFISFDQDQETPVCFEM